MSSLKFRNHMLHGQHRTKTCVDRIHCPPFQLCLPVQTVDATHRVGSFHNDFAAGPYLQGLSSIRPSTGLLEIDYGLGLGDLGFLIVWSVSTEKSRKSEKVWWTMASSSP